MERIGDSVERVLAEATVLAAANFVVDAAVRWNLQWRNVPALEFLVMDVGERYRLPAPFDQDRVYHPFKTDKGTYWIHRRPPLVTFLFEDPRPPGDEGRGDERSHGALGRTVITPSGEEYRTYGGWSSSAGAINRLRAEREDVAAFLPEDVVDASYRKGEWGALGIAGTCWDLSFAQGQVERFCKGVGLFTVHAPADDQANAEQALFVWAGAENAPTGATWVPYPLETPGVKPAEGDDLYLATSEELRYKAAIAARQAR